MANPTAPSRFRWQKCTSQLVDASTATFEYTCLTCGHRWRSVLKLRTGPGGAKRPASPDACRLMARVWKGYGRMNAHCPKCSKRDPRTRLIGPRNSGCL